MSDSVQIDGSEKNWRLAMEKMARERDAWREEALAARKMRDEINNYSVGISLLTETKFYRHLCRYHDSRKETDNLLLNSSRIEGMDMNYEFIKATTS